MARGEKGLAKGVGKDYGKRKRISTMRSASISKVSQKENQEQ